MERAFSLVEVLALVACLALLILVAFPGLSKAKRRSDRISCVSRLKNIGLSFRIFSTDHTNAFPWQLSTNAEGSEEFASDANSAWRQFSIISNELSTPMILVCPSDKQRIVARDFLQFTNNRFLSYTLGLNAAEDNPESILSSDRNVVLDGLPLSNAIVSFRSNAVIAFDPRIHNEAGNVVLGDGSVQQMTSLQLRDLFNRALTSGRSNVLIFP